MIGGEEFILTGKTPISPGFTAAMPWQAIKEDEKAPKLDKGQELKFVDASIVERQTSPPDYLTEAELITLMEKVKHSKKFFFFEFPIPFSKFFEFLPFKFKTLFYFFCSTE